MNNDAQANGVDTAWHTLADFELPSQPGVDRRAFELVVEAVRPLDQPPAWLDRLGTAAAEAVLNAAEHGNQYQADLPVQVRVAAGAGHVSVRVSDFGSGAQALPATPDLAAKLAGEQPARGWGLYLMEKMVDQLHVSHDGRRHTVELVMTLDGDADARSAPAGRSA